MSEFTRTRSNALASLIFLSRWLQAPLYLGLIVAQGVYVYHFIIELFHLIGKAAHIEEKEIMLTVLGFNLVRDGLRDALDPQLKP